MEKNKYRIDIVTPEVAKSITNHVRLLKTDRNHNLKQKTRQAFFLMDRDCKEKKDSNRHHNLGGRQ